MNNVSNTVSKLFKVREEFIIIGLTGRTGSGCTTAANLLERTFSELSPPEPILSDKLSNGKRKYRILHRYAEKHWQPFKRISVRNIISSFILETPYEDFEKFVSNKFQENDISVNKSIKDSLSSISDEYKRLSITWKTLQKRFNDEAENQKENSEEEILNFYFIDLSQFTSKLVRILNDLSQHADLVIYQHVGINIRSSGNIIDDTFDPQNIFQIADRTKRLIKLLRSPKKKEGKGIFIVIDAIRNPFEAFFFRERFSAFYLVSINTPDEDRIERLFKVGFNKSQIKFIDDQEYPSKLAGNKTFVSQDLGKCIEWSDIHINNPQEFADNPNYLKRQLVWYVALMLHPGLVIPTGTERAMQIAYSAKLNSGCISRQVGAVITDQHHSLKAVGWNSTPEGQVPCVLRDVKNLLENKDEEAFSNYESVNEDFRKHLVEIYSIFKKDKDAIANSSKNLEVLEGRNVSFCFKDIKNSLDEEKNQVHTRSLHAEENAFLQITKYGGEGILGGFLFTTASPCELCAKKAYQLGISKIFYIDPYPGIANKQILEVGSDRRPKLHLFNGAIGRAYHQLYQPIFAYKDELNMLLDIKLPKLPMLEKEQNLTLEKWEEEKKQYDEKNEKNEKEIAALKKELEEIKALKQLETNIKEATPEINGSEK